MRLLLKLSRLALAAAPLVLLMVEPALAKVVTNAKLDAATSNALDTIQYYGPLIGAASAAGGYAYQHFAVDADQKDKGNRWIKGSFVAAGGTAIAPSIIDIIKGIFS